MNIKRTLLAAAFALWGSAAIAAPDLVFATSTGIQPGNVGIVTLHEVTPTSVQVTVDLISATYGFLNTGGPHTPFAFNLAGTEAGVSAIFTTPAGGTFAFGVFTLSTTDGGNTPFGTFGVSIDSSAGNGSGNAYYGDLVFTVTRASGLTNADFISNGTAFFSADLTDGQNTGAQGWAGPGVPGGTPPPVPEPASIALFGTALLGLGALARRRRRAA